MGVTPFTCSTARTPNKDSFTFFAVFVPHTDSVLGEGYVFKKDSSFVRATRTCDENENQFRNAVNMCTTSRITFLNQKHSDRTSSNNPIGIEMVSHFGTE